eukprot:4200379-Ditylum_brightwellii.AAC.1
MSTPILADDVLENPKTASTWRMVDLPEEILHYLTVHNCRHFGQAHNTPFTVPLLSQYFDWAANSPMSETILQGKFTDTELTELQQLFLKDCKMAPIKKYVGKKITCVMWKGKVAAWRESTTTLLSGCHLGHFKAVIRHFAEDPNTDEGQIMYQKKLI